MGRALRTEVEGHLVRPEATHLAGWIGQRMNGLFTYMLRLAVCGLMQARRKGYSGPNADNITQRKMGHQCRPKERRTMGACISNSGR